MLRRAWLMASLMWMAVAPKFALAYRVHEEEELTELTPGKKWYVEESEVTKEKLFEDLGCYCKKVRSVAECPSSKEGKRSDQPERSRWFHGEVATGEKRPHLCCKLAWSAWYNRVFQLCTEELRPLESDVCCRVGEEEQKVGVHIKQAKGLGFQKVGIREWHAKLFGKSRPIFKLSDVTGGTDYDGSPVSAPIVQHFLEKRLQAGLLQVASGVDGADAVPGEDTALLCSQHFQDLDQGDCRLRTQRPDECCCLEATVQEARRCLPVPSGASSFVGPLLVNGTYTETKLHDLDAGSIAWPSSPEEMDKELPEKVISKDPKAPEQIEYDWAPGGYQWEAKCLGNQTVSYVTSEKKSKRVRSGTSFRHIGQVTQSVPVYTTKRWTEYNQEHKEECISYEYTRICPANLGLYVKQYPPGICTKVPGKSNDDQLQLMDLGALTYQCPEGYQSGTEGGMKFDPHCSCTSDEEEGSKTSCT
ncbi:unnamed protein product [Durusdinium trenchii]